MERIIQLLTLLLLLICSQVSATTVRYQHTDMLGSVVAESDSAGNIISRSHYEPFGKRLGGDKAGIGYTGHLQDEDLNLTYMQARYYDPLIGRFYSNDPVGAIAHLGMSNGIHGFNRYAYANNNPYRFVDPTGMAVEVSLKAYPIGQAPIVGKYGHAFVEYRDTDTGESRITRGGPSQSYPGGASDAIMDSSFDGVNLIANDTPASESADFGEAGTKTLMSASVDKTGVVA